MILPPPPPPRILLLRGVCLSKVFEFLDENDVENASASCRLLRDADFNEKVDSNSSINNEDDDIEENVPPSPTSSVSTPLTKHEFVISVPPGKLGIRLENRPSKCGTIVTLIADGSPLEGKVTVGDLIVGVNDVDVGRMDTYGMCLVLDMLSSLTLYLRIDHNICSLYPGILEVFQRYLNEERILTVIRPNEYSVSTSEGFMSASDIMTPSIDNRKLARELEEPFICKDQEPSNLIVSESCMDSQEPNIAAMSIKQSKSIMRLGSVSPTVQHLQTTPFNAPTTVPSTDSSLQLESLDLNSYESMNLAPSPNRASNTNRDAIPFDELDTGARPPNFSETDEHPIFVVPETQSITLAYEDDDTITSATSSYVSSLGTDDSSYMEEQAGYLSQFVDAAMFHDKTLFTSLVHDILDTAKHAAKYVVTERGDPIDDQGPIKIGDNYYTHREAIAKWRKARDKIQQSTKYKNNDEKLQRKLEKAAMDAAQLMAATKTCDLAARRAGYHMEKKENKMAAEALKKLEELNELDSVARDWERRELEHIKSWEIEKEAKRIKDLKQSSSLSIHQLVNQMPILGFSMDDENREAQDDEPSLSRSEVRVDFVEEISADESTKYVDEEMSEYKSVKHETFQYLTTSRDEEEEEDEPFDCIIDKAKSRAEAAEISNCVSLGIGKTDSSVFSGIEKVEDSEEKCAQEVGSEASSIYAGIDEEILDDTIDVFPTQDSVVEDNLAGLPDQETRTKDTDEEIVWEPQVVLRDAESPTASIHSRDIRSSSPATLISHESSSNSLAGTNYTGITNASSVTERVRNPCCITKKKDTKVGLDSLLSSANQNSIHGNVEADATKSIEGSASDNKSPTSNASESTVERGVEVASSYTESGLFSGESSFGRSDLLSGGESTLTGTRSGLISGGDTTAYTEATDNDSLQSFALCTTSPKRSQSKPSTILEEAVVFLLEASQACQGGDISVCPSAHSKYTLDSLIGSEYGTEILFNAPPKPSPPAPSCTPVHTPERVVTERKPRISIAPSPNRKASSPIKKVSKRLNPLKQLIKSQSSKKSTNKPSDNTPRQVTPERPTQSSAKSLRMGFGVMRGRS